MPGLSRLHSEIVLAGNGQRDDALPDTVHVDLDDHRLVLLISVFVLVVGLFVIGDGLASAFFLSFPFYFSLSVVLDLCSCPDPPSSPPWAFSSSLSGASGDFSSLLSTAKIHTASDAMLLADMSSPAVVRPTLVEAVK